MENKILAPIFSDQILTLFNSIVIFLHEKNKDNNSEIDTLVSKKKSKLVMASTIYNVRPAIRSTTSSNFKTTSTRSF